MPDVTPNTVTVTMDNGESFKIEKGSTNYKHIMKALEDAKDREFAEHRTAANNLLNGTIRKEVMPHLTAEQIAGLDGQVYLVAFGKNGIESTALLPSDRVTVKPMKGAKKP